MFEGFTDDVKRSMAMANREAMRSNQRYIGPEHLLLGIAATSMGPGSIALAKFNVSIERLQPLIEKLTSPEQVSRADISVPHSPRTKHIVGKAIEGARALGNRFVDNGHLLMALVTEELGIFSQILLTLEIDPEEISKQVLHARKDQSNEGEEFHAFFMLWKRLPAGKREEAFRLVNELIDGPPK